MLFYVLVHCKHSLDQGRLTWRHNSILNHIAGCLKSSTNELYCGLDELQAPGGRLILADVLVQAQRRNHFIHDRLVHGRHRLALVKLTCPWDTDAKRTKKCKASRYADIKTALSNEGWDCSLYMIKVGAGGHIHKLVKDRLWSLFWAWVPAGRPVCWQSNLFCFR
jgi:hypothetical protein